MAHERSVYRGKDGLWRDKRDDAAKAAGRHRTQAEAKKAARRHLKNDGGGELKVMGLDGKIRSKDTIAPGNDPNPPKDREH